jgi:DNA repair photolyase
LRGELARELEPRAPQPARRLHAIEALAASGIPVGVLVAPVIPGLTDHEMPAILGECRKAGAAIAGYVPLRLPFGLAPLFEEWLALHAPLQKEKILNRVREIRDGRLNDPNFGTRLRGKGEYAEHLKKLFELTCRKVGLNASRPQLRSDGFRRPGSQMNLFG